jgi:hypothetical protein
MRVQEEFVSITTTPTIVEQYLTVPALMDGWRSPLTVLEPLEGELMALGSMHKLRLKTLALAGATYTVTERDSSHILMVAEGPWQGTDLWRWWADGARVVVQNRVEYEISDPSLRVFVYGFGFLFAQLDMRIQMERLRQQIEGPNPSSRPLQRVEIE